MTRYEVRVTDRRGAYAARLGALIDALPSQSERDAEWALLAAKAERGKRVQDKLNHRPMQPWTPARLAAHFAPRGNVRWMRRAAT